MTSFKCRECENHWNEGPTRDHRTDQLCRECLIHKLRVCHADAENGLRVANIPDCSTVGYLKTIQLTSANAIDRANRAGVKNPGVEEGVRIACRMLALYTARTNCDLLDLTARELEALVNSEAESQSISRSIGKLI